ncbi:MAG: hypothetical protein JWQ96_1210 [Segetibacter sp.]|nr:hypothetical protein [Segetibacter sp.]
MKYVITILAFLFLLACNDKKAEKAENAIDAGRQFIDLSLKGKFNDAKQYMLQDDDNLYWLTKSNEAFNKYSEQEKTQFSQASINILEVADVVKDSVTIISFSNSYRNQPQKVKVVKYKGDWLVDFKYTFSGNL